MIAQMSSTNICSTTVLRGFGFFFAFGNHATDFLNVMLWFHEDNGDLISRNHICVLNVVWQVRHVWSFA